MNDITYFLSIPMYPVPYVKQVYPLGTTKVSVTATQERETFDFIKSLSGSLVFDNRNGDYDLIVNYYKTVEIKLLIKKAGVQFFEGIFTALNCEEVDGFEKTIKVKPSENSEISKIMKTWDLEKNILNAPNSQSVLYYSETKLQFFSTEGDASGIAGWQMLKDSGHYSRDWFNLFAREWSPIKLDDTFVQLTNSEGVEYPGYVRGWSHQYPTLATNLVTTPTSYTYVGAFGYNGATVYYVNPSLIPVNSIERTFGNGRTLKDVLTYLFSESSTYTLKSSLLFHDANEEGSSAIFSTDPVYSAVDLSNSRMFGASDIKRADASEESTVLKASLKDLFNDLKVLFKSIALFVDTQGNLRIEHTNYFQYLASNSFDLRTVTNAKGVSYVQNMLTASVSDSEKFKFEKLRYAYSVDAANSCEIENFPYLALSGTNELSTKLLISDFYNLILKPDSFPDTGVVLLLKNASTSEVAKLNDKYNGFFDMPNLAAIYHKYERISSSYSIDGATAISAGSKVKNNIMKDVQFPFSALGLSLASLNIKALRFKTFLNPTVYAEVDSFSYDLTTNFVKINLKYEL